MGLFNERVSTRPEVIKIVDNSRKLLTQIQFSRNENVVEYTTAESALEAIITVINCESLTSISSNALTKETKDQLLGLLNTAARLVSGNLDSNDICMLASVSPLVSLEPFLDNLDDTIEYFIPPLQVVIEEILSIVDILINYTDEEYSSIDLDNMDYENKENEEKDYDYDE